MQAISRIVNRLGSCTFLESGAGGPIVKMARNAVPPSPSETQTHEHTFVAVSGKDMVGSLAQATTTLWKNGQTAVQFWPFHRSQLSSYCPQDLPPYEFERQRHWLEYIPKADEGTKEHPDIQSAPAAVCPHCSKCVQDLPYISRDQVQDKGDGVLVFNVDTRSRRYQDLVQGHAVVGTPICPAAMYLELASHAVTLLRSEENKDDGIPEITINGLTIKAPLGLDSKRLVRLILTPKSDHSWGLQLISALNDNADNKSITHATGTISLCESSSSIANTQAENRNWACASTLLEGDGETNALRGAMVYRVFQKMAKYSSVYRGLRHVVGRRHESAGDIEITREEDLEAAARTPNPAVASPLLMDVFLQVPGIFVHSLRDDDDDDGNDDYDDDKGTAMSFICTGMGSVGPLNGMPDGKSFKAYAQITKESNKEVCLDVFAFDKTSKRVVWSARDLTFSRVPRKSLAQALAAANPATASPHTSSPASINVSSSPAKRDFTEATSSAAPTEAQRSDGSSAPETLRVIQGILHRSLDVPVEAITGNSTLEDLGADSLVSSEILSALCDAFRVQIPNEDFTAVTDVEYLCVLVESYSKPHADAASTRKIGTGDTSNDHGTENGFGEELGRDSEWTTLLEILSKSLEVPSVDIQMESKLDDLGADSLVAAEILSNVNEAFSIDISTAEFASMEDVKSLFSRITGPTSNETMQSNSAISSDSSSYVPTSATDTCESSQTNSGNLTPIKSEGDGEWVHKSFQQVSRNFDSHAEQTMFRGYWDTVYPQQLSTVVAFIIEAFQKLGCSLDVKPGHAMASPQRILPKYHRELLRLWDILVEAGVVERKNDGFVRGAVNLHQITGNKSAEELSTMLVSDFPPYASTHGLPKLLGPHLAECLTGKSDPVSLLFGSEKGRDLLNDFYANAPDLRAATQLLCDFVSTAIRSYVADDGEPFRILEIGAGTGGKQVP